MYSFKCKPSKPSKFFKILSFTFYYYYILLLLKIYVYCTCIYIYYISLLYSIVFYTKITRPGLYYKISVYLYFTCIRVYLYTHQHTFLLHLPIQFLNSSTLTCKSVAPHCLNHGLPNKISAGTLSFGFLCTQLPQNSLNSLLHLLPSVLGGKNGSGLSKTV